MQPHFSSAMPSILDQGPEPFMPAVTLGELFYSTELPVRSPSREIGPPAPEPFATVGFVLPELNDEGELPPGVHVAEWQEFQTRFCGSSSRRLWLAGRLRALLKLAATNGKLRRVFIWGSFVTAKPAP
jgi:hypothetical protein